MSVLIITRQFRQILIMSNEMTTKANSFTRNAKTHLGATDTPSDADAIQAVKQFNSRSRHHLTRINELQLELSSLSKYIWRLEKRLNQSRQKDHDVHPDTLLRFHAVTEQLKLSVKEYAALEASPPRTVVIGSVPRSGGTWTYNAVREIFKTSKLPHLSGWYKDFEFDESYKYHIIKVHHQKDYANVPWKIITNTRPLENRLASMIRMGWLKNTNKHILEEARKQIELYDSWEADSDLDVSYSAIMDNPITVVETLADFIGLEVNSETAAKIVKHLNEELSSPETEYDKSTLLHPEHRAKDTKKSENKALEIRALLDKHGL